MNVAPAALAELGPAELRALLPGFLAGFVHEPGAAGRIRARVGELLAATPDLALRSMMADLLVLGDGPGPYPAQPVARAVQRVWAEEVVTAVDLAGLEHLDAARALGPVVLVGNHLSYFDTGALDAALVRVGRADVADRIWAAAGPKVYASAFRRFASAGLGTLPVPQSTQLDGAAALPPRELAKRAIEALKAAEALVSQGEVLLLYPEGSRSRTGRLRPFLRAIRRWLDLPGASVVPVAVTGGEGIFPIGDDAIFPGPVRVRFGPALAEEGGEARLLAAREALAGLLPEAHRPEPGEESLL